MDSWNRWHSWHCCFPDKAFPANCHSPSSCSSWLRICQGGIKQNSGLSVPANTNRGMQCEKEKSLHVERVQQNQSKLNKQRKRGPPRNSGDFVMQLEKIKLSFYLHPSSSSLGRGEIGCTPVSVQTQLWVSQVTSEGGEDCEHSFHSQAAPTDQLKGYWFLPPGNSLFQCASSPHSALLGTSIAWSLFLW